MAIKCSFFIPFFGQLFYHFIYYYNDLNGVNFLQKQNLMHSGAQRVADATDVFIIPGYSFKLFKIVQYVKLAICY